VAAISFSLTQPIIVDTIRTLSYNPPLSIRDCDECCDDLLYAIQSELLTRVTAVFISTFALADSFIHLMSGIYKASLIALAHFGCLNPPEYTLDEVSLHFQKAAFFTTLAIVGPFVGFVWPNAFRYYWFAPERAGQFQQLILQVEAGQPDAAWPQLRRWFDQSSMAEKLQFFYIFDQDKPKEYQVIRRLFSEAFYKPVPGQREHHGWLTPAEISARMELQNDPLVQQAQTELARLASESEIVSESSSDEEVATYEQLRADGFEIPKKSSALDIQARIEQIFDQAVRFNLGFYFHGTRTEVSFQAILQSVVEVRHQGAFRGAFVSNQPEGGYGPYYFAFKKNIEFLSDPLINMSHGGGVVWSGFSDNIPVTEETLAYVAVQGQSQEQCNILAKRCKEWTGRDVAVIPLETIQPRLDKMKAAGPRNIPRGWQVRNN